jgi:beta-mannosidase
MPSKTPIDSHWSFSQVSSPTWADVKEEWTTCASFPTSVHVELRKQGRIPDPFKGLNEWEVQCEWVGPVCAAKRTDERAAGRL